MDEEQGKINWHDFLRGSAGTAGALAIIATFNVDGGLRFLLSEPAQAAAIAAPNSEQASEVRRLFTEAPNDPEYPNQIADLARLTEGSEQGYLDALQRYSELYVLAHPNYIPDPNNPAPDASNSAFILGGGIGNTETGFIDRDTSILRGTAAHTYSRNWDAGGDNTFTVFANNNISNNMIGPFAVSDNSTGLTGISPVPGMVIPGVIRTESDTSPLRQTKALEAAVSWVAKDPKGVTVVAAAGIFTEPSGILIDQIEKAAEKGVLIVLAPGSTLTNRAEIVPNVIIAGSSDGQNEGAIDVALPGQMRGYLNPVDINQVSGSHIPVAEMTAILQMAQGLRPAGMPLIPVSEMRALIQEYGADQQGNFVHLQAFLEAVAMRYGLVEPTPTPTPTSTDVSPTSTATVIPSATPTHTPTTVPPTVTPTPSPEPPQKHRLYFPLISQAIAGLARLFGR